MFNRFMVSLIVLTTVFPSTGSVRADESQKIRVYFGTYRTDSSRGIYLSSLDATTGQLSQPELVVEAMNPSFLAIHPSNKFLYAVSEVSSFDDKPVGSVCAYSIEPSNGHLKLLNSQPTSGAGPCQLVVDAAGKFVLTANYGGGSVTVLPIADNGYLNQFSSSVQHQGKGPNPDRQEAPHAHSINLDSANKYAFAADLGLDQILVYHYDKAKGTLKANAPPFASVAPGSGPRHFAFHPSGKFAFVNNEMTSTVTAFTYDAAHGVLKEIHTLSTLPKETPGNSTAEIVVHPSGKFLYVSNRGHDSLAIFKIDESTGRLQALGHQSTGGKTPRNFNIDPTAKFVIAANQDTNNVVVLKIDNSTGLLTPTGHSIEVGRPVCVRFLVGSK